MGDYDHIDDPDKVKELKFNERLSYWFVDGDTVNRVLVGNAYDRMGVEKATKVQQELDKAIEFLSE